MTPRTKTPRSHRGTEIICRVAACHGAARPGEVRHGGLWLGKARRGQVGSGMVRPGTASLGMAWCGVAWFAEAWPGGVRHGFTSRALNRARGEFVVVRPGGPRPGMAWLGMARFHSPLARLTARGRLRRGTARPDMAWLDKPRFGLVISPLSRLTARGRLPARSGKACRGMASQAVVWQGWHGFTLRALNRARAAFSLKNASARRSVGFTSSAPIGESL